MNIVQQLLQILLLKRGPEDLEYNETAAYVACGLYIYTNYLIKVVLGTYSLPFSYTLVESLALIAFLFLAMSMLDLKNRFVQFVTGYFGVLSLQAAAVVLMVSTGGSTGIFLICILASVWIMIVALKILIKTVDRGLLLPISLWFASNLVSSLILTMIFPQFSAESEQTLAALQQLLQPAPQ